MLKHLAHLNEGEKADILADFMQIVSFKAVKKGEIIHHPATICNSLFLVQSGLLRVYYLKDGKDITAHFALENETITAIDSYIQRKQSKYTIEALEDSTVLVLNKKDIDALVLRKPKHEKVLTIFLEQIYIDLVDRIESLLFYSSEERYHNLIEKQPELLLRANLGHIASYIGISQETLSRVRANS